MADKLIYIIAGEESGDVLGTRLIQSLQQTSDFDFRGIGGHGMQSAGLKTIFPMDELSVMGLFEIVPKLPNLIKRINQTVDDIAEHSPDIIITIDSPDFCKRVVKKARSRVPNTTRFIHYVAPTVWAWRAGRAATMAELFDGLICLLPFEPPYFEREGLNAKFCGHPLTEAISNEQYERDPSEILILPGSRRGEVARMGPIFAKVFEHMQNNYPKLKASIVALPHVRSEIEGFFKQCNPTYIDPSKRFDAFKKAGFALATSGTVGLELAVAQCPHIVAYKVNSLTYQVARHMIKTPYAHLVNIMEGQELVPEFMQNKCSVDNILNGLNTMQKQDFTLIRDKLSGETPSKTPSQQAADFILTYL
jgi:lipid-A-disaccharide synthase